MEKKKFSIKARLKSFQYAFAGILTLIKNEHNARIHLFAALCALLTGWLLNISVTEWLIIILCIGFVIMAEAMNSAVEYLADFATADKHELIKKAKDVAAAGVLFAAISAITAGMIIFIPKIYGLLS